MNPKGRFARFFDQAKRHEILGKVHHQLFLLFFFFFLFFSILRKRKERKKKAISLTGHGSWVTDDHTHPHTTGYICRTQLNGWTWTWRTWVWDGVDGWMGW